MLRYHKLVYIPEEHISKLQNITDILNTMQWAYSNHTLDNLKYRAIRIEDILYFIKSLKLLASSIFEYYTDDNGKILKACYRITYTDNIDLILVISKSKEIITIYTNTKDDEHFTLDTSLYIKNTKV
jgi:hypothetical protein